MLLVIQVEGSGILLGDLLQLLQGDKRLFHVHRSFFVWPRPAQPDGLHANSGLISLVYLFSSLKSMKTTYNPRPFPAPNAEKEEICRPFLLHFFSWV